MLEQAALHLTLEAPTKCTDLTAILVARIERLQPDERVLLQVLAVAAEPVPELTVLTAAGVKSGSGPVRSLLAANLVRRVGTVGHCLVPFHDQLREVIVARLAPEEARAINVAIADALDTNRQGQPEALVAYYLAGGERHRAAHYVAAAAKRMAQALAFDRAVKLFRISLDLAPELGNEETQRMRVGLADALVNCGRVEEGARQRLEAAARLDSGGERDRLTGQAAAELVRAGRIDEGLQHAQNTFASLGLRLSRSSVGAVASIIADRVRLSIRGLDHQVRPAAAISPKLLKRVDWCQSLAIVLPVVDTLRGFQVHNQGLLWALEAGEPARLGQALAMEAGFQMALAGGRDATGKVRQLLDSARMLADASGDPRARGVVEIVVGSTRWSAGDWSGCVRHTEEGVAMLRRHCAGVFWEVNFGQTHALDALSWMGQLRKKNAILLEELEQARGRGDLYAETMYTLRDLPTLHLIADRGDEAEACAHALESWPNRGFQVEHMANLYKQAEVELYRGEGAAATKRVEAEWDNLARSQLTRLQPFRIELNALRGRAALAAAHSLPTGSARKRLLQLAARVVQSLGREPPSVRGAVFGAPVAAGVAVLRGDREEAARCLEKGVRAASESGMRLYEEALRYQLGRLTGGDEGRKAMSDAETWMRSEGMRRPDRYIPMLCPAIEP